jgi:5'-nucleotidase
MRILITNDDGINAPGLVTLANIAAELAGDTGEVWTIAPATEQSGVGHCISYIHPMRLQKLGKRTYTIDGFPADCVLAALHHVMKDTPPDLILSGINRGNNAAENTLYSGTIGAAIEGALQGVQAIAMSQYLGLGNGHLSDPFEAAATHGADVVRAILASGTHDGQRPYPLFYNVNFPPVPADKVKGVRAAAQGRRPGVVFGVEPQKSPSGRTYLWIAGGPQTKASAPGTDAAENLDGYISVTPMRADLTDTAALATLAETLKK